MASATLTKNQRDAVRTVGRDLLVAASAGTGKTTVLSQRCVFLLTEEKIALKDILAVTFTEAAAADMRRKIANELRVRVAENPDDSHLRLQLLLIDRAPICTLDSFCLKVLRENFHQLGLDPGFTVLDADEGKLLRAEVADRLLEEWFGKEGELGDRFLALAEAYGGKDGDRLADVILRLHDFLQTLADPNIWREQARRAYNVTGFDGFHWKDLLATTWKHELDRGRALAEDAWKLVKEADGLEGYRQHFDDIRERVNDLHGRLGSPFTASLATELAEAVRDFAWQKLPPVRGITEEDREAVKKNNDALKKCFREGLLAKLARQTPDEFLADVRQVGPFIELLLHLQKDFEVEYRAAKDQQGVLDFNDLERYCHELLTTKPSVARELRKRFKHLLVDEYQDINPLQDEIIQSLSCGADGVKGNHLFMVGDEKQSIYGFRLAAPDIFMVKYHRFVADLEMPEARISLTHNFRCRKGVIYAVNYIFERIAVKELGSSYDDAKLTYGADYGAHPGIPDIVPVDVHLLEAKLQVEEKDESGEEGDAEPAGETGEISAAEQTALEREAHLVAQEIHKLIDAQTPIWDGDEYRPARFRDVVILLRATSRRADTMASVLKNQGVPVYADLNSGFFDALEVRDTIALLEVLDNAQQDVPLTTVLRSPLVGLTENQLALVRVRNPAVRFPAAVEEYRKNGDDNEIRANLERFHVRVEKWRKDAVQLPLARVVWEIYRETNYLGFVEGLSAGDARRANLIQLHDRARQFDTFSRRGLCRFLRFLRRLKDADRDFGAAPTLSESEDVVRIMSIHKSKGLEYPIVFVPDLAKKFNERDLRQNALLHRDHLIGMDRVDLDKMERAATLPKVLIGEAKRLEVLAEEQRLLYVALTRARERLILCGTAKLDDLGRMWQPCGLDAGQSRVLAARCMLDWIGPVLGGHPNSADVLGTKVPLGKTELSLSLKLHHADEMKGWSMAKPVPSARQGVSFADLAAAAPIQVTANDATRAAVDAACKRLQWTYPRPNSTKLSGKVNVTEFKRRLHAATAEEHPGREQFARELPRRPEFMSEGPGEIVATERGTATHAVLQHLDFNAILDEATLRSQMARLVERKILLPRHADAVDVQSLLGFVARPLGQRLRKAHRINREMPFALLIPAAELAGKQQLSDAEKSESILITGTMDCLMWDDEGIVLLDYKTDKTDVAGVGKLVDSYRPQIELYRRAVKAIFGQDVKEAYLAFLTPGADVKV